MKASQHAIVAVPTSLSLWVLTGYNVWYLIMSLFLGFLIDVDHVWDYVREERKFDFKHMFIKSYTGDFKKLHIVFHCLEYVPIAWIIGLIIGGEAVTFAAVFTIAYLSHMIPDLLSNNVHPLGYFFIFRAIKKFEMREIFHQEDTWAKK